MESWRVQPDDDQIREITSDVGKQMADKWISGKRRYGNLFQGTPGREVLMELMDGIVYNYYMSEQLAHVTDLLGECLSHLPVNDYTPPNDTQSMSSADLVKCIQDFVIDYYKTDLAVEIDV